MIFSVTRASFQHWYTCKILMSSHSCIILPQNFTTLRNSSHGYNYQATRWTAWPSEFIMLDIRTTASDLALFPSSRMKQISRIHDIGKKEKLTNPDISESHSCFNFHRSFLVLALCRNLKQLESIHTRCLNENGHLNPLDLGRRI